MRIFLFIMLISVVFFVIISPILLLLIFFIWVIIIIRAFVNSKHTKKPFLEHLAVRSRKKLLIITFLLTVISTAFVGVNYHKARKCIILPNGYTIGQKAVFDLHYMSGGVYNIILKDPKGKVLPVYDVDWISYRIKLNTLNKEHRSYHDPKLTNPLLYEFSYKGGSVFYIKAKKFTDWKEIYGNDFIENTPQPHEYYIGSGLYGIFSFYNELKNNPLYPTKNCSVDIFKFTKGY